MAMLPCVAACGCGPRGACDCPALPVMSACLHGAMKVESNAFPLEFPWRSNFLSPLKLPR
jgi:hypothetical protein